MILEIPTKMFWSLSYALEGMAEQQLLWAGIRGSRFADTRAQWCAAHALDISTLAAASGFARREFLWVRAAELLYERACEAAGWDQGELNSFLSLALESA